MIDTAIDSAVPLPPVMMAGAMRVDGGRDAEAFDATLARHISKEHVAAARDAVTKLVSSVFVAPLLSAMRSSPMLEGPFAPGTGERRFGPLFDTEIADRVTKAARFPLVDAILDRYRIAEHIARQESLLQEPGHDRRPAQSSQVES